jgi:Skp family chaperone for outer membrane proteins
MNPSLPRLLVGLLLLSLLASPTAALAQGKIGTVNLRVLFDGYFKRKLADAKIKERAGELDKELDEMLAKKKAAEENYTKANAGAGDLAASKEERDRRKADAEQKAFAVKQIEQDIGKFRQQAEAILREQQTRMRTRVLEEINTEVEAKAKADGYYMVIDKDADSRNDTKVIVYHNGEHDITEAVLAKLNASAPAKLDLGPDTIPAKLAK